MTGPGAPHVPRISYPAPVSGIAPTGIVAARDGIVVIFSGPGATCHGPADPHETAMHVFNVHTQSLVTADRPVDLPHEATLRFVVSMLPGDRRCAYRSRTTGSMASAGVKPKTWP